MGWLASLVCLGPSARELGRHVAHRAAGSVMRIDARRTEDRHAVLTAPRGAQARDLDGDVPQPQDRGGDELLRPFLVLQVGDLDALQRAFLLDHGPGQFDSQAHRAPCETWIASASFRMHGAH